MVPQFLQIAGRPIEPDAFIVLRPGDRAVALIEPEGNVFVVHHAADQSIVAPHGAVHGEPETIDPEAQALFQIRAGNYRSTGLNFHGCLHVNRTGTLHPATSSSAGTWQAIPPEFRSADTVARHRLRKTPMTKPDQPLARQIDWPAL